MYGKFGSLHKNSLLCTYVLLIGRVREFLRLGIFSFFFGWQMLIAESGTKRTSAESNSKRTVDHIYGRLLVRYTMFFV